MSAWTPAVWLKGQISKILDEKIGKPSTTGNGITLCDLKTVLDYVEITYEDTRAIYGFIPPVSGVYTVTIKGSLYTSGKELRFGALPRQNFILGWVGDSFDELAGSAPTIIPGSEVDVFDKMYYSCLEDNTSRGAFSADIMPLVRWFAPETLDTTSTSTITFKCTLMKDEPTLIFVTNTGSSTSDDVYLDVEQLKITYGNE